MPATVFSNVGRGSPGFDVVDRCGSMVSPDGPAVATEADGAAEDDDGADCAADVCDSTALTTAERNGDGATRGRWKRARKSFGGACEGSWT